MKYATIVFLLLLKYVIVILILLPANVFAQTPSTSWPMTFNTSSSVVSRESDEFPNHRLNPGTKTTNDLFYNSTSEAYEFPGYWGNLLFNNHQDIDFDLSTNNKSVETWVKPYYHNVNNDSLTILNQHFDFAGDQGSLFQISQAAKIIFQYGANQQLSSGSVQEGQWSHLVWTMNTTHVCYYINGTLDSCDSVTFVNDDTCSNTDTTCSLIGAEEQTKSGGDYGFRQFNGSMGGIWFYDTALNATEVAARYAIGKPSSGSTPITATVNYSSVIGNVSDYFWCANTHGWPGNANSNVQVSSASCSTTQANNITFHWSAKDAALTSERFDLNTQSYAIFLENHHMTNAYYNGSIYNRTVQFTGSGTVTDIPLWDWLSESVSATGNISWTSADFYDGPSSANISKDATSGSLFVRQSFGSSAFVAGTTYNLTGYFKGNSSTRAKIHLQETNGFTDVCSSGTITGNDSWQFLNCSWTPGTTYSGYRVVIEAVTGGFGDHLFDNVSLTMNGSMYVSFSGDTRQTYITNMTQRGLAAMFIPSYLPRGLLNFTDIANECDGYDDANYFFRCAPETSTYGEVAYVIRKHIEWLKGSNELNFTIGGYNEPDIGFWLPTLSYATTNQTICSLRANKFILLQKAYYDEFKAAFPTVMVGTGAFADISWNQTSDCQDEFFEIVMNGTVGYFDYLDYHNYFGLTGEENAADDEGNANRVCSALGINSTCANSFMSEFNVADIPTKNLTANADLYGAEIASYIDRRLEYSPQGMACFYVWSSQNLYGSCQSEYPQKWNMVSEPAQDNYIAPPYYLYENGKTYFPSGTNIMANIDSEPFLYVTPGLNPDGTNALFAASLRDTVQNASVAISGINAATATNDNGSTYQVVGGFLNFTQEAYDQSWFTITLGLSDCGSTYTGSRVAVTNTQAYYTANSSCGYNGTRAVGSISCNKAGGCS